MKNLLPLILSLFLAAPAFGQVAITGSAGGNVQIGGGAGSGNGVQYNPATTAYIITSFSGLYDDNHDLSNPVAVASFTCAAGTCTVNTSAAHNLKPTVGNTENNYVDVTTMTGFGATDQSTGIGSFPVATAPTSTQFTFASTSTATCSSSCGSIYDASYWALYQTANQPFLKNSGGTVDGVFSTLTNLNTNFSSLINCTLGTPTYLIIESGQNDIAGGATAPTLEALYQSVWTKAHSAGCIVIQGSLVPANYGGSPPTTMPQAYAIFNVWVAQQAKSFALQSSGEYWDRFIDYNASLSWRQVGTLGSDSQSARNFAQRTNEALANQSDSESGPPPLFFQGSSGNDLGATVPVNWHFFSANDNNPFMNWIPQGDGQLQLLSYNTAYPLDIEGTNGTGNNLLVNIGGPNGGGFDTMTETFNEVSHNNAANYFAFTTPSGAGSKDLLRMFPGTNVIQFPQIVASSGLAALCVDISGNVQTGSCGSGSTLDANTINTPQYASGGGTANAQTVTLSPSIASLSSGMHVRWKPSSSNTGPMTLAVNSISPVNVTKCGTTALVSGDVTNGIIADGTYDGIEIQLTNPQAVACAGGAPGVTSIDTLAGAFTFGGAVSHVGNAYTFGGGSVDVNGSSVSSPNFNAATPAAPGGNTNCTWQVSGSSVSCYVPTSSGGSSFPFTTVQETPLLCAPSSNNCVFTFPQTTASSGNTDLLFCGSDGSLTLTTPSGWTLMFDQTTGTSGGHVTGYSKASASDTAATVGLGTSASVGLMACQFMEIVGSHSFDHGAGGNGAINASPPNLVQFVTFPSITPTAGAVVYGVVSYGANRDLFTSVLTTPNWKVFGMSNDNGSFGRSIVGLASTIAATATATTPPPMPLTNSTNSVVAAGFPIAWETFSIK